MVSRFFFRSPWLPGILIALIFSSCASGPKIQVRDPSLGEFAYLAPGGLAYFHVDVNRARPILAQITMKDVDMPQTMRILRRVDFVSGAVYPPEAKRKILLHAWRQKGNIPGSAGLVLNPRWKQTLSETGGKYWHSERAGLSVSIQNTQAFVSDRDPFTDGTPISLPEKLNELRWDALLLGWLENAGTSINNFLSTIGLPVNIPTERILFGIYESTGQGPDDDDAGSPEAGSAKDLPEPLYEMRLRVETGNANQAKALAALLAFVRVLAENPNINVDQEFLEVLRPLLVNPPSQDGPDLVIQTSPLNAQGIALLFSRFAVYSQ
jgi:hypothetical protein